MTTPPIPATVTCSGTPNAVALENFRRYLWECEQEDAEPVALAFPCHQVGLGRTEA